MTDTNNQSPTDLPPVDTSLIQIEINQLESPDYRMNVEVPPVLIAEIKTRLKDGGLNYDELELIKLILQISTDEAMQRLDKDSAFGCRVVTEKNVKYEEGKPLVFSLVTDTIPNDEFSIDEIPIQRRTLVIKDTHVDEELYEQRLQFGMKTPVDGVLEYGDEISCEATCSIESVDNPIVENQQCVLKVPSESQRFFFNGIPLPEVGEAMRGSQTSKELSFEFDVQGTRGKLELRNCAFNRVSPATVEQVLAEYGTPSEGLLRTQIKMSLQNSFDRDNANFMLNQFYSFLLNNVDLPVSARITDMHFARKLKEVESQAKNELTDEQKDHIRQNTERLVKRLTLNAWLQRTFKVKVSETDLDNQAAIIAEERRVRPADIREEYRSEDKLQILSSMVIDRKIFEKLKDKMVFTEIQ